MLEFTAHASSSAGNLYTLDDGKTRIIIDPGLPIIQIKKALNFQLFGVSGALVGHLHKDHSAGLTELMKAGIDVYTGISTIEALNLTGHRMYPVEHLKLFSIGTFKILPFKIPHDVDNLGFLIQSGKDKFLYLIDYTYCPYKFKGLTHIAIGINFETDILKKNMERGYLHPALARRIMQSHCSLKTGLEFFRDQDLSQVQEIHILHVSEANADKNRIKEAVQRQTGKLVLI